MKTERMWVEKERKKKEKACETKIIWERKEKVWMWGRENESKNVRKKKRMKGKYNKIEKINARPPQKKQRKKRNGKRKENELKSNHLFIHFFALLLYAISIQVHSSPYLPAFFILSNL